MKTKEVKRPKGTLEDLTMLDREIRRRSSFYPDKSILWRKAQILGIGRKSFDEWAYYRQWYRSYKETDDVES